MTSSGAVATGAVRRRAVACLAAAVAGLLGLALLTGPTAAPAASAPGAAQDDPARATLRLVTLAGPGTAGVARGARPGAHDRLRAQQDRTLAGVGAPEPVYRWTTALNGYAVELTDAQARQLGAQRLVVAVEDDAVRPLAARAEGPLAPGAPSRATRGGAGVVVGVVDSGVDPEHPVFADGTRLGRTPSAFRGGCAAGDDDAACGEKVVGARWFAAGFGRDRLASSATLTPRDDAGHGTAVASIAAGNSGVGVSATDRLGSYAGVAPQARVASYKACWTAPDPSQDGCATSDLVTAVDRATADRVDVLTVAAGGPERVDTLDRALLGAAEADVVVVTAAGNDGASSYAAHSTPWSLTIGAHTTPVARGRLVLAGGTRVTGAMAARRTLRGVTVVPGADAPSAGADRRAAGLCRPGSLDAAAVRGAVVVCSRGGVSRLAKSTTVDRAGGAGMVLTNRRGQDQTLDVHRIPVLHLGAEEAGRLRAALRGGADGTLRARLEPAGVDETASPRPTGWSPGGDPAGPLVAPALLAPGVSVLGATPPGPDSTRWRSVSGTSAAAAVTAGAAARLRAERPGWSADRVRSALTTSALPLDGAAVLRQGAGRLRSESARNPGLHYEVAPRDLRRYLDGDLAPSAVNTPSVLVRAADGPTTVVRRVRNVTGRELYFSSQADGFARDRVRVRPAALRLGPGERAEFRIEVAPARRGAASDDGGTVTWRGADGSRVRIPVVLTR